MVQFKEQLEKHQIELINKGTLFDGAHGGGIFRKKPHAHLLEKGKEQNNLFPDIRESVRNYFSHYGIPFWSTGQTVTPNTLSSQVSCLNHLFVLRDDENLVKTVMQSLIGNKIHIQRVLPVPERVIYTGKKSDVIEHPSTFISFEAVSLSATNQLNEGKPLRGHNRTSIDALCLVQDDNGKIYTLVIEWKLKEDDSGNKAPSKDNSKEYNAGGTRIKRYSDLIASCKIKDECVFKDAGTKEFRDNPLFCLPFYELMRQTLWANVYKGDFGATDYLHIEVIPEGNPMRTKVYKGVGNGIENSWKSLLNQQAAERYILADPYNIVETLEHLQNNKKCSRLAEYLKQRYYSLK